MKIMITFVGSQYTNDQNELYRPEKRLPKKQPSMQAKCYRAMRRAIEMPIPIVHVQANAPAGVGLGRHGRP